MRQAGRYLPEYRQLRSGAKSFLDMCYTPDLATEVTLQPIRRFGFDGAIIFSDILVIPDALGQDVGFVQGEGPRLGAIRTREELGDLCPVDAIDERVRTHLGPVYQAVRNVAGELPPEVTLLGFAGAPWTVATYVVEGGSSRDFGAVKGWAYGDPDGFQLLIDRLVAATVEHLAAQIEAGAAAVQIFESWAGVLPAVAFERWCVAPVRSIISQLKARHPDVPVIAFPRAAGLLYDGYRAATGADVLGLDTMVPTAWARDHLQTEGPVQGNLDPQLLIAGGAEMTAAIDRILADLAGGPFVFNLGHGILPVTPIAHVEALLSQVRAEPAS